MERLFIYGSLQPGAPNEHVLAPLEGDWQPAVVKGRLIESGWGAELGYPGMVIDPGGEDIPGQLLSSRSLTAMWSELDALEGEEYERVVTPVILESGEQVDAWVYALRN